MREEIMRKVIEKTRAGIKAGQSPFGSAVVSNGKIISLEHNTVWKDSDPTAHAEVNAIRAAARELGTIELVDCELYSSCEPCPMCLTAIHWSKIPVVWFGASIADALEAGFSELIISAKDMVRLGGSPLEVHAGLLTSECQKLFTEWKDKGAQGY